MNPFPSLFRHPGQALRLGLTVAFLALGLAVSSLALSLQQDLVRFFRAMDQPAPLWVGQVQSNGGDWFFNVFHGNVDQADLDRIALLVPRAQWTPYFANNDSGFDRDLDVGFPPRERQMVRSKVFAGPLILKLLHAPLVAGRIPTEAEVRTKKYALVTLEVAQTLFGGASPALGQTLRPILGNFPAINGNFEVCGVIGTPNQLQSQYGYPDILFLPDDELTTVLLSPASGRVYGSRIAFDPETVDPRVLADQIVPLLAQTHPSLDLDRFETWQGGANARNIGETLQEIRRGSDQVFVAASFLTILFLVVSCLSVLSFMFVNITSRSQAIAVERALGRPFGHFVTQAFAQGSLMVLGAAVVAGGVDLALLPGLTQVLGDPNAMGSLLPDSQGRLSLDLPTVALLGLASAALAGLVAVLPLLPYRTIPIAVPMKDDS